MAMTYKVGNSNLSMEYTPHTCSLRGITRTDPLQLFKQHITSQIKPVRDPIPLIEDSFQYYSPIYARSSKRSLSLGLPTKKPCVQLSCLPKLPNAPPISFLLIWSHEWYLISSIEHKAIQLKGFRLMIKLRFDTSYCFLRPTLVYTINHTMKLDINKLTLRY